LQQGCNLQQMILLFNLMDVKVVLTLHVLHTIIKQVDVKITLLKHLGDCYMKCLTMRKNMKHQKKSFLCNLNQLEMVTIIIQHFHIEIEGAKA
jgi:hypothetical protein